MSLDEFNQLIGRSLMFNAQVSGNYDEDKHALRMKQASELKRTLEITLQIKDSLENLQDSGHFAFPTYRLRQGSEAVILNQALEEESERLLAAEE